MRKKYSLNHHIQPLDSSFLKMQHILANPLNSKGTRSTLSFLIEKTDLVQSLSCEMGKTCKQKLQKYMKEYPGLRWWFPIHKIHSQMMCWKEGKGSILVYRFLILQMQKSSSLAEKHTK